MDHIQIERLQSLLNEKEQTIATLRHQLSVKPQTHVQVKVDNSEIHRLEGIIKNKDHRIHELEETIAKLRE